LNKAVAFLNQDIKRDEQCKEKYLENMLEKRDPFDKEIYYSAQIA